ncbi:MAG TPA: hypothetical protein VFR76_11145, partial [Verrucomicrobiae bacterium]|nr:hypothetical protein [Verrucomicrobiae bacterium]
AVSSATFRISPRLEHYQLDLRKELAAMNLDWPGAPLLPDRSAAGKIRITVVSEPSTPANSQ